MLFIVKLALWCYRGIVAYPCGGLDVHVRYRTLSTDICCVCGVCTDMTYCTCGLGQSIMQALRHKSCTGCLATAVPTFVAFLCTN